MTGLAGRMPVVFFGHGSPMVAIEENATTAAWRGLARALPRPRAVLCVSAHWLTRGVAVTAMTAPRTIHDFGASFPRALFEVRYPAPGDPELAGRVRDLLAPTPVTLDSSAWGLDHGAWSVLCKLYPDADVPVVQLSMDATQPPAFHFEIGQRLAPLRDAGVLIMASGNIVHNLPKMTWNAPDGPPHPWAARFNAAITLAIAEDKPQRVIAYAEQGEDAASSVPTPDHFWPLLYALGARQAGDAATFITDHVEYGSLSMTGVVLAPPASAAVQ